METHPWPVNQRRSAPLPASRRPSPRSPGSTCAPAGGRGLHLRHAPQPVLRPLRRVRAAPRVHPRRRHPPPRLEGLVQDRPLLHQAVRGRNQPALPRWSSTSASRCTTAAAPLNKYNYACTIAACLAYLLLRQQDAVGLHHLRLRTCARSCRPRSQQTHIDAIVKAMDVSRPRDKTDIEKILRRVAENDRRPRHDRDRSPTCSSIASRCSAAWKCCATAGTTSSSSTSWTTTS